MTDSSAPTESTVTPEKPPISLDVLIRFSLIAILAICCYLIVNPFIIPVLWGLIIAVALHSVHAWVSQKMGQRNGLAAFLLAAVMVGALVGPSIMLINSSIESVEEPLHQLQSGSYELPDLPEKVPSWPLVGKQIESFWTAAQTNLPATLRENEETVKSAATWLAGTLASAAFSVLQSIFSIIIAAIFWVNAPVLIRGCNHVAERLFGDGGSEYVTLSSKTIESVAQGVVGVALIQATMAAVGLLAVGAPLAGFWAVLVLIFAVAQLPPILILGPVAAYIFSVESSMVATLFLIWCLVINFSDAILKPMLLGRGLDIPMIVILVGAIGGMLMWGILGLFIGSIVLALAYLITQRWAINK